MDRVGEKEMSRGALLFAFNSPKFDYYSMAEFTAKRINHFLNLPVTIVTNDDSISNISDYKFDNVIKVNPEGTNNFRDTIWFNKGRYQALELTPYDETLLLDVDYLVNSNKLLKVFDYIEDYVCHESTAFLMVPDAGAETVAPYSYQTLWATVMGFKKTNKTKQLFDCMKMVQNNYAHYADIHGFPAEIFRNDYALSISHRLINGHINSNKEILPWNLMHIGLKTKVYADNDIENNTAYTVIYDSWRNGKIKKEYINITDLDFHVINKDIFLGLMK